MLSAVDSKRFGFALFTATLLVGITWLSWLLAGFAGIDPGWLGVRPGEISGLVGVVSSPFAHGSFMHIFSNTLPLFILTGLAVYAYKGLFYKIIPFIIIGEGLSVWLIGMQGTSHIGASGLIYGLASFLFFGGIIRWEPRQLVISAVVIFLYGSFIWGILPMEPGISWEGHLSGAVAGAVLAFWYRKVKTWPHEPLPDPDAGPDIPGFIVFEQDARSALRMKDDPLQGSGGGWENGRR